MDKAALRELGLTEGLLNHFEADDLDLSSATVAHRPTTGGHRRLQDVALWRCGNAEPLLATQSK
jgi:hypothetical protein